MSNVNKVILVGYLGKDPEIRAFSNGERIATFSVATTERWRDKSGELRENTEWHTVVCTGRVVEVVEQYLRKGSLVYVEGRIRTRKWQDKQTGQDRYTTEIRLDQLNMLGGRPDTQGQAGAPRRAPAQQPAHTNDGFGNMDDDIPF